MTEEGQVKNFLVSLSEVPNQKAVTIKEKIISLVTENNWDHTKIASITFDSCPAMKVAQRMINDK